MIIRNSAVADRLQKLSDRLPWFSSWLPVACGQGLQASTLICPTASAGVHRWLFITALRLRSYWLSDEQIAELLEAATRDCGREVPDREIADAVRNSRSERPAWSQAGPILGSASSSTNPAAPRWPARNYSLIQEIGRSGPSMAELADLTPERCRQLRHNQVQVLDLLFPGNPLLCCGWELNRGNTLPRDWWLDHLDGVQFIVPSAMSAKKGRTRDGRLSFRCLDNTGPRLYLVVEFDFQERDKAGNDTPDAPVLQALAAAGRSIKDLCASLIAHLASYAPLVLVVDSGGKSLHGWFDAKTATSGQLTRFMSYAVSIGADPMTFTPCQFVRIPGGVRDNGRVQEVIFFDADRIANK